MRPPPRTRWGLAALCLLWMVPVVGLFVTSLRTRDAQQSSGWWTALANPLDFTQWTLSNYTTS